MIFVQIRLYNQKYSTREFQKDNSWGVTASKTEVVVAVVIIMWYKLKIHLIHDTMYKKRIFQWM